MEMIHTMTALLPASGRSAAHHGPSPEDGSDSPDAGRGSATNDRLRTAVEAAAAALDGGRLPESHPDVLRERIRLLERLRGVTTTGLADTVRALGTCGAITDDGAASPVEWLKANTGRSGRDAARVARLATDLADLPATRAALANGELTDEAADAVVRAARDGRLGPPAKVDADLLDLATSSSPEDLRAEIRARQQAADGGALLGDERRQHARRSFRMWRKDTGMWGVSGELPDELGQTFRTGLDTFDHPDPETTPPEHRRRPDQRRCDALEALVGAVLDRGLAPGTGGITRPHLSVIVDARTVSADLVRPRADDPDAAAAAPAPDDPRWTDLAPGAAPWGGHLSPQAVRRICCDASVSRIVMDGPSQVLDVGRATREWSGPQRRAVNARDRTCRGPNCSRPIAWTSIHHVRWWQRDRGPTDVDNGLALCHHCHRLVHDRGWTVELDPDTASATWTSPAGGVRVTRPGMPTDCRSHRTMIEDPPARVPDADDLFAHASGGPPRR